MILTDKGKTEETRKRRNRGMEAIRERMQVQLTDAEEAQRHNAMINERYRRLQNAEADQFSEQNTEEQRVTETAQANVAAQETPLYISPLNAALEQTPVVTEYVSAAASAVFTTEKFEAVKGYDAPVEITAPVKATETTVEARYALTPLAKIVMAVFTFVVIAMLTMICINTHIIRQKNVRIKNLEEKKEQLLEQSEEIQKRIEAARSEESIRQYAEANGMILAGN